MNMRKNDLITPVAKRILHMGMIPIYAVILWLGHSVASAAPYSPATAEDFGRLVEYPVAALALLTALVFMADRIARSEKSKEK